MKLNIKEAVKFPFTTDGWKQKLLIGGLFYLGMGLLQFPFRIINSLPKNVLHDLISSLNIMPIGYKIAVIAFAVILIIASVIISAFPQGYILQTINYQINGNNNVLPQWKTFFSQYLRYGLIIWLINFIYGLVLLLILAIPTIIFIALFWAKNMVIFWILQILYTLLVILAFACISPFIMVMYSKKFNFTEAFNISEMLKRISKAPGEYFVSILISIVFSCIVAFLSVILTCTCIGAWIPFFLMLPTTIIIMHLYAQTYNISEQTLEN